MNKKAIQDYYPDNVAKCYGCGPLNEHGLKIKSYVDGDETVCIYAPMEYHKAFEGFVYGGLIASIIDCHSLATAVASTAKELDSSSTVGRPFLSKMPVITMSHFVKAPKGGATELKFNIVFKEIIA